MHIGSSYTTSSPGHALPPIRARKLRAAALSVVSNATLTLLKLIIGVWSGSVSILSEAVHSATDLVASAIALFSVRASDTPPDSEHPFGHGKIESVSGLMESMLILGAAGYIIHQVVQRLRAPIAPTDHALSVGIGVMAFSMGCNYLISRYIFYVARETDSQALRADASHLQADVLTSLGVFIGLFLVRVSRQVWLDPLVAAIVACILLKTAYRLMRDAIQLLLDVRLPESEEMNIRVVLEKDDRVLGYHKLRTRKSGSQRHADVHVQLDDDISLVYAHQIAEELEDAIRAVLPKVFVNIHIEPFDAEIKHQRDAHGISLLAQRPRHPDSGSKLNIKEEVLPE